jgi:hypothetical protein
MFDFGFWILDFGFWILEVVGWTSPTENRVSHFQYFEKLMGGYIHDTSK